MEFYLYFKALHVIAIISWMAGMLYLPRLFAYHSSRHNSKETNEIFVLMEKRLLKFIMNPALLASWVFGAVLVLHPQSNVQILSLWFLIKAIAVLLMSFLHFYFAYCRKKMETNNSFHSESFYKVINEIPTVLLIIVVIMVVVRPFS